MNHSTAEQGSDWPDAKMYPKSIRAHFAFYVAIIIVAMMVITSVIVSEMYASAVTQGIVERLLSQARSYSGSAAKPLLTGESPDALMLNSLCRKLSDDSEDIYWSAITDSDERLVAHTDVRQITSLGQLPNWNTAGEQDLLRLDEAYALANDTVRIRVPIRDHQLVVGQLELAASAEPIRVARTQSLITMASVGLAVLLLGLPLTMFLTHRKLRPIATIAEHLQNTKPGDLNIDIPIESRDEFGYLADTLHIMGKKVTDAQLQVVERERMAKELEIAREIQANILPKTFPGNARLESCGFYKSAKEVGGDYFDFIEIDSDRLGVLVADVSGKSLPGMLVMLLTRDIVRQQSRSIGNPAELLCRVNQELLPNIRRGMFVTMFYGVLNHTTGVFDFASAGHNPLLYVAANDHKISQFSPKGFPLGLMPPKQFDQRLTLESLKLKDGDVLVQYSDGINEAQNAAGEEFGMDRFVNSVLHGSNLPVEEIVGGVMAGLDEFVAAAPQYDDITLMALKWHLQSAENSLAVDPEGNHEDRHQTV